MQENFATNRSVKKAGPLVSVLIPTYNRRKLLPVALASVVRQDYGNLEIFVIRDGGEQVGDIVRSFNDPRIIFVDREQNRGVAFTLNEAVARAQGKYICYLGDDDLYYPHHVSTLLGALEDAGGCEVAYSDLYKTYCRPGPDGSREVLSKVVEISRDFDRFLMLYFNHSLHVSLMHTRDILDKIGPYNEKLTVLIDWDLTRRLVFFSDFYHVHRITGEFYSPIGESDRISFLQRRDEKEFMRNVLTIRTTRPPKPWPKIEDMSIIFLTDHFDRQAASALGSIWRYTFYPYKLFLPLSPADSGRLSTDMPNIVRVPVEPGLSATDRVDAALEQCDGEYVTIVPAGFPVDDMWMEDALNALIGGNSGVTRKTGSEAIELEGSTQQQFAVVLRKSDLQIARRKFARLHLRESLKAAGVTIRRCAPEELPFQFDQLLQEARQAEKNGSWTEAADIFEYIAEHYKNELWMKTLAARSHFNAANLSRAKELSCETNRQRPVVDTLLLEAKIRYRQNDFNSAIDLLKQAEQILQGEELSWT